ncbi:hypothetical protein TNCV_2466051 [Trichonephila clavipes]|nr:hypothetical protein TNCV_2466051 [Trichonephila clavipes]
MLRRPWQGLTLKVLVREKCLSGLLRGGGKALHSSPMFEFSFPLATEGARTGASKVSPVCVLECGGSSESVQEFAARINKLGTQIFQSSNSVLTTAARNANDQLLQSRFISGLRNDIRRFVLARDPNTLEESINATLIEEQNLKLNEIASNERSGLSSLPTESPVISALTDKLQELNLRVERLQEASTVIAREMSKGESHGKVNVFKCFYCGLEGHRQAECRKRIADQRSWNSSRFRRSVIYIGVKFPFLAHSTCQSTTRSFRRLGPSR